jgi:hypothetical protein
MTSPLEARIGESLISCLLTTWRFIRTRPLWLYQRFLPRKSKEDFFILAECPSAIVRWAGVLTPCCYDPNATVPLGNLIYESIEDILSVPRLRVIVGEILAKPEARKILQQHIACDSCPLRHKAIRQYRFV